MMKNDTELRVMLTFDADATEAEKVQITRMLADMVTESMENEMRFTQLGDILHDFKIMLHRA
jgi:hypothetical protein